MTCGVGSALVFCRFLLGDAGGGSTGSTYREDGAGRRGVWSSLRLDFFFGGLSSTSKGGIGLTLGSVPNTRRRKDISEGIIG